MIKTSRTVAFAGLSVALVLFLSQTPDDRLFAHGGTPGRQHYTLRLKVNFTDFHSTNPGFDSTNLTVLAIGDQFTLGGTVARFGRPADVIGHFGVHFVATAPMGAYLLANGALILPDGKITFQMLVGPSDTLDVRAAITGGTGAYLNAGGELIHHRRPNGDEEFIFRFVTD